MNIEEFTKIKDFEDYFINKNGDIITTKYNTLKFIKGKLDKDGYRTVGIRNNDGIRKHLRVHRIVAKTFIDNINNFPIVNHLDGNVSNNHVNNLEWTTIKGNNLHTFRVLGRVPKATTNIPTTLKNLKTNEIISFTSRKDCAIYFDYSDRHMCRLLNDKSDWESSRMKDWKVIE